MAELERLGREARSELGEPPPAWLREQRAALGRAFSQSTKSRKSWPFVVALAAALTVVAVLVAARWPAEERAPLETTLSALSDPRRITLADGSSLTLDAHTRAKLVAARSATTCRVELGTVTFDVTPQGNRQFSVIAGRVEVRVVGTRFSVARDSAGLVEVRVSHGIVRAQVPERSAPVELRAGDYLRANDDAVSLAHPAPDASSALVSPAIRAEDVPPAARASADEPKSVAKAARAEIGRDGWRELYAARNYVAAVAAARQLGIDGLLANLNVQQLAELADAARLAGDSELSLRVLASIERRFPTSREAQDASFLSGRILAGRGQAAQARSRFEAYLARNAQGGYSLEAMGRLVELYSASRDTRATSMARAYLQRAPHGPYERLCQSVLAAQ